MKIGLLTYHDTTNYGATLQCVALANALQLLNADCEVINYQCNSIVKRELPYIELNGSFRNFLGSLYRYPSRWIKHLFLHKFLSQNCKISPKYVLETIEKANEVYDSFIVGSDILWNLEINGYDYTYFLNFVLDDTKKNSYGTSSGGEWGRDDVPVVCNYLSKFTKIAVRESFTAAFLNKCIDMNIEVVCDPTMLLESSYWKNFIKKNSAKDYVLVYLPNKKCLNDARLYAQKNKLRLKKLHCYSSMQDFFTAINNAAVIFTGSYHGLLFAMYFHTNFFYYNFQDTFRMDFLKDKFGIGVYDATHVDNIAVLSAPDWKELDRKIADFRVKSFDYLRSILK